MKTTKLTAVFAAISLLAGVAFAQDAATPAVGEATPATMQTPANQAAKAKLAKKGKKGKKGNKGKTAGKEKTGKGENHMGPYVKLRAAMSLDSVDAAQKEKIKTFAKEHKADGEELRKEMQAGMQKARQETDREARMAAMKPAQEKSMAAGKQVDTFLASTLTPEQMQEVDMKTQEMFAGGRFNNKTRAGDKRTSGAKGHKTGKDGKRWNREKGQQGQNKKAMKSGDAKTSGPQSPNPFSE